MRAFKEIFKAPPFVQRLLSGSAVNLYGQLMIAAVQLLSVPILASIWGVTLYGEWIMLNTIPT